MALVAWILAVVGAGLAFALCAGSSTGLTRRIDRPSAIAVMPLPLMAVYFTANDLLALVRAGPPYEGLVFVGGPFVIGLVTLGGVVWAARGQHNRGDWIWTEAGAPCSGGQPVRGYLPTLTESAKVAGVNHPTPGGRMSNDSPHGPESTREFLALWNDTVEEHLVRQLAQALPDLARDISLDDSAHAAALARPLVRALRLSAVSGDAAAAVRYLVDAAGPDHSEPAPGPRG
jgi:hypothetical protein